MLVFLFNKFINKKSSIDYLPRLVTALLYSSLYSLMILTITGFLLQEFIIPQDLPKINKIRDWDLEINIKNYQNSQYCETEIKYKYPEYGNYAENVRYLHSKTTSYFFLCLFSHTLLFFSNRRYVIYKKTFLFLIIGNFTCLFVAFIGFTVPWGHNCWFEHYSQFKEFENQVYENINRNRIFWYLAIKNFFGIYTFRIHIFYWVHFNFPIFLWYLIINHYRSFYKERRPFPAYPHRPRIIWLQEPGKSINDSEQLQRLSKVFALHHPIQIIRMLSAIMTHIIFIKYFPDSAYFPNKADQSWSFYNYFEQTIIVYEPYVFPWYLDIFIAILEMPPNKYFGFVILIWYCYFWFSIYSLKINCRIPVEMEIGHIDRILLIVILVLFGCFMRGYYLEYSFAWQIFFFFNHFFFLNLFVNKYWKLFAKLEKESLFSWFDRIIIGELENWWLYNFLTDYSKKEVFLWIFFYNFCLFCFICLILLY